MLKLFKASFFLLILILIFLFSNSEAKAQTYSFTVHGTVFLDTNSNGSQDSGESGFPIQWTNSINSNPPIAEYDSQGQYKTGVGTDNQGKYSISNTDFNSGGYMIKLAIPSGYQMSVGSNNVIINVTKDSDFTVNFALKSASNSVSPSPSTFCIPRPPCLDATPKCAIAEPAQGWCTHPSTTPLSSPSPTANSNSTTLSFNLALDGIGTAGDHLSPGKGGNANPNTPNRTIAVQIYNTNNQLVDTKNGNIFYNPGTGRFTGNVTLKPEFTSGPYVVMVKSSRYLRRNIGSVSNLKAEQTNAMPQDSLTAGDILEDNTISVQDYNILMSCSVYSKDNGGACKEKPGFKTLSDLNDDGKVNENDYSLLLREWSVQSGN